MFRISRFGDHQLLLKLAAGQFWDVKAFDMCGKPNAVRPRNDLIEYEIMSL